MKTIICLTTLLLCGCATNSANDQQPSAAKLIYQWDDSSSEARLEEVTPSELRHRYIIAGVRCYDRTLVQLAWRSQPEVQVSAPGYDWVLLNLPDASGLWLGDRFQIIDPKAIIYLDGQPVGIAPQYDHPVCVQLRLVPPQHEVLE